MTARSIRRAAERKQRKLAHKAEKAVAASATSLFETAPMQIADDPRGVEACLDQRDFDESSEHLSFDPEPAESFSVSPAQLAANRANAQHSTGAKTAEGKAVSCLNAVKTALTGRTVMLSSEDAPEYQRHIRAYQKELRPIGQRESDLVQSIADTAWRLKRIPGLEMAFFAQGRVQLADSFKDHDPSLRAGMMELQTLITYEKQLRNLQLQEARLSRRREKETAELRQLQQERSRREAEDLRNLGNLYLLAKHDKKHFDPAAYGFEFSVDEVECYLEGARATEFGQQLKKQQRDRARTEVQAA